MSRLAAAEREERLDAVFSALADPTRRRILARLAKGTASISELAGPFEMTLPGFSKHLRVLEGAGLLRLEREGRVRHCHLEAGPLETAAEFIAHYGPFWEGTLDRLAEHLERSAPAASSGKAGKSSPSRKTKGPRP